VRSNRLESDWGSGGDSVDTAIRPTRRKKEDEEKILTRSARWSRGGEMSAAFIGQELEREYWTLDEGGTGKMRPICQEERQDFQRAKTSLNGKSHILCAKPLNLRGPSDLI